MSAIDRSNQGRPLFEVRDGALVSTKTGRKMVVKDTSEEGLRRACNAFNNCPKPPVQSKMPLAAKEGHAKPLSTKPLPQKPTEKQNASRATNAATGANRVYNKTPIEGKPARVSVEDDTDTQEIESLSGSEEGLQTPTERKATDTKPLSTTQESTDVRWAHKPDEAKAKTRAGKIGTRGPIPDFSSSTKETESTRARPAAPITTPLKPESPQKTIQALKEFNNYSGGPPKLLRVATSETDEKYLEFKEVAKEGKLKGTLRGIFPGKIGLSDDFKPDQVMAVFSDAWSSSSGNAGTSFEDVKTLTEFCKKVQTQSTDKSLSGIDRRVKDQIQDLGTLIESKQIVPSQLRQSVEKAKLAEVETLAGKLKGASTKEEKTVLMDVLHKKLEELDYGKAPTESLPADNAKVLAGRSEFIAKLVKAAGFEAMKDLAIHVINQEVDAILKADARKGTFQSEFRQTSVASTVYRGLVTAEFPDLKEGGPVFEKMTKIMSVKTTSGIEKADQMMDTIIESLSTSSENFKALHKGMLDPFTKLYSLRQNPEGDARTLAGSMVFIRFVNPFVALKGQELKDKTIGEGATLLQNAVNMKLFQKKSAVIGSNVSAEEQKKAQEASELREQQNAFLQNTLFPKAQLLQKAILGG